MSGLAEILEENTRLRAEIALRDAKLEALTRKAEYLAQRLELEQSKHSGPASQRYVAEEQEALPFGIDMVPPPRAPVLTPPDEPEGGTPSKRAKKPRRRKRESLSNLPARSVRCGASDTPCARCGKTLTVIDTATSFRAEWVPGHFEVHDVARDKCACKHCPGEGVLTVPGPYALVRSLAANGLLARVLVDKFADHIPANR